MARDVIIQHDQSKELQPDQRLILWHQVIQEGILQARQSADQAYWSFLIATVVSTASAVVGLSGAGCLLFGASEGTVTTAVGLASGMYSYQLAKEAAERQKQANDRLAQLFQKLQDNED